MPAADKLRHLKIQTLQHFWGHSAFRDLQEEVIDTVLAGQDALVLLPTGGGKSLCYQLPALLLEGTCLVISPLLALMKDQVYHLKMQGIEAEYLSSELDEFDAETIFNRCKEGLTKILYVSPERLTNQLFLQNLEEMQISFIAVDEAHCISEWGQDFRPSYQNISSFRRLLSKIPLIALTATATKKVLAEIQAKLELRNPKIFQQSFRRTNITIVSDKISNKYERVLNLLKYNQSSGIIYARTRRETEDLTAFLHRNQIGDVDFFHAGLSLREKNERQKQWINSQRKVLVSTNAFGMGIDKDFVRFVLHLSPPQSLENYYQEIGRAGRDGAESHAFLLWNEQELKNFDQLLANQTPSREEFRKIVSHLYSLFQIADQDLAEEMYQLPVQRMQTSTRLSLAKIKNVLNFLHNQEIIFYRQQNSLSSLELKIQPDQLEFLSKSDAYFIETLLRTFAGLGRQKVLFSEQKLAAKFESQPHFLRTRLRELQDKGFLTYIDGALASIRFLKHRDDRALHNSGWKLFENIQQNKIRKWEEMKFFVEDTSYCKMKLILAYFGEKNAKNCGKCSSCRQEAEKVFGKDISGEILAILKQSPANAEEIAVRLHYYGKDNILENLIHLLDAGKVKMLNFRTYTAT